MTLADHIHHVTAPALKATRRQAWFDGFWWGALFGLAILLGSQAVVWAVVFP